MPTKTSNDSNKTSDHFVIQFLSHYKLSNQKSFGKSEVWAQDTDYFPSTWQSCLALNNTYFMYY